MPGITGIISKSSKEKNEENLHQMIKIMMHEPFYTSGKYINDKSGIYLGWVCINDSFCDCMPISNEKKDIFMFFSGENLIDKSIIDNLKAQGHTFHSSNNASYLVHLYEENGEDFLKILNGFFSGIIVDTRTQKTILFNDRYGMNRIYYHETEESFYFSSEAKSLLKICPWLREIDLEGLGQFMSCGCVLGNETIFKNLSLLPAASKWIFNDNISVKKESYFKPEEWENQTVLDKETFYNKLKDTFHHILPKYFELQKPVAFSLTGGLDTRMILASIDLKKGSLPCYTFGGIYRDCYDVKFARKVAAACGQPHQTIKLNNNFLNSFPTLAERTVYLTDGCLDVSGAPNLFVFELARNVASVRITGNYGDEILRRHRVFKPNPPNRKLFNPDFVDYVENTENQFKEMTKGHPLTFAAFKQAPWYQSGRLTLENAILIHRSPYMDNDLVKLVYQASPDVISSYDVTLRLIGDGNPTLRKMITDRGIGSQSNFVIANLIRFYYEFLFKMDYYANHGMPKWLSKFEHTFSLFQMERIFLGRHKYYHFRIWYRDEWSDYIRQTLLDQRSISRGYLNRNEMKTIIDGHTSGKYNYTYEISKLLTLELTQRLLIEDI